MLKEERLEKLEEYIIANRFASVQDMAERFHISKATVRRDLEVLTKNDAFKLTRGGVSYQRKALVSELPYHEKQLLNREEKSRICKAACDLIEEGATIIVDTGTTTREMVPYLLEKKNIYVVTNDLMIATELASNCEIELTLVGGKLRTGYYTLRGYAAEDFLRQLHVDITFLSLDAVNVDFGCAVFNMDEVAIKQHMIQSADETVVLCDHSKFKTNAFLKVANIEDVDLFITGKELCRETADRFREKDLKLKLV